VVAGDGRSSRCALSEESYMAKYDLLPNEIVLLKDDAVFHGKAASGELTLTNLNLFVMHKGMFGNSKGFQTFPVNQIKVYNGRAQALMNKTRGGHEVLEVYFLDGEEEFRFSSGGKKKIQTWIGKINEAVTGQPAPEVGSFALPGVDLVAGVLKDTLGAFKSKRGAKPAPLISVATKCVSCGAAVSGVQGQAITCPYCLAAQQL
jgi:hypothetical protein